MDQGSSWEANSSSATEENASMLWNPKFLAQIHAILSYVLKIHFNIIILNTARSSSRSV